MTSEIHEIQFIYNGNEVPIFISEKRFSKLPNNETLFHIWEDELIIVVGKSSSKYHQIIISNISSDYLAGEYGSPLKKIVINNFCRVSNGEVSDYNLSRGIGSWYSIFYRLFENSQVPEENHHCQMKLDNVHVGIVVGIMALWKMGGKLFVEKKVGKSEIHLSNVVQSKGRYKGPVRVFIDEQYAVQGLMS